MSNYQSLLIVSFGGPEGEDDVMPFLENVLRGKNIPRERMLEVAEHYRHFGGVSPINEQNRDLIRALENRLSERGIDLPIYWGNRNWNPMLAETIDQMTREGITQSLAFFTSIYSCYSGCRQYRENIAAACQCVGESAPQIHKLRMCFNHPSFISAGASRVADELVRVPVEARVNVQLVFTAHSIPQTMADNCDYELQLRESSRLVVEALKQQGFGELKWDLVFQSRSGPPQQPWLGPDVCDFMDTVKQRGAEHVVVMPIGFISDHMEVLYDLDTEAQQACDDLELKMYRAKTVGVHPQFIDMIVDLICERMKGNSKLAIGNLPAWHDVCPENCCLPGARPGRPAETSAIQG